MRELKMILNETALRRLAGERSYHRGAEYYRLGCVERFEETASGVRAWVRGERVYAVQLADPTGGLQHSCECPHGSEGAFCKHCVAAALAWIHRDAEPATSGTDRATKQVTLADAGQFLLEEDPRVLVRMLLEWAKDDELLTGRVLLYAARRAGPDSGAAAVRQAFRMAVDVPGFVPYREAYGWASNVHQAMDHIARLLEDGQAAAVIDLCESALQDLDGLVGAIDDSDGHLTSLRERLEELHFRACQEAPPDPVALASRLFRFEMESELDVFFGAAETYREILGPDGLNEYRRLAEAEWEKVPASTPGQETTEFVQHFRITNVMESLAKAAGDLDALVAVMSRDLSSAYSYLQIAQVYRDAQQHDQALLWAEKGLAAFPDHTDRRLREFAAEEYHRRERHGDALELIWLEFAERPGLETYRSLERHAQPGNAWPEWRERALLEIRRRIAAAKHQFLSLNQPPWMRVHADHSVLVEIFLHEGDSDAAWREASEGGCSDRLWLRMAAAREKDRPEDAAPVYLEQGERAVAEVRNGRYEEAVGLLIKAASLMKRLGRSEEFVRSLEALRQKYKIKRNFIKLLAQEEGSLYR
jgi:uncharacterized Zn finger protein